MDDKKRRIYLGLTPIIIVSIIIVYNSNNLNACNGLKDIFGGIIMFFILFLSVFIFLLIQIIKSIKFKHARIHRRVAVAIALGLSFVAVQGNSYWKDFKYGNPILEAAIYADHLNIGRLELLDSSHFLVLYGHIDWSCSFTGEYLVNGDTLILKGEPLERTQGIISNKYLIADSLLIPLNTNKEIHETQQMWIVK